MKKIPVRKCPKCGLYHDVSVLKCTECETDLCNTKIILVSPDEIPVEVYGEIDEGRTYYVQKCSACGALNFTSNIKEPVKICFNCHKTRIATIVPIVYNTEDATATDEIESVREEQLDMEGRIEPAVFSEQIDDDEDEDTSEWDNLLGNIRQIVNPNQSVQANHIKDEVGTKKSIVHESGRKIDQVIEAEEDIDSWDDLLGTTSVSKKEDVPKLRRTITLTAIRYGSLTFSVEPVENQKYMLGRSANQSEFLDQDKQVGNEHCYLYYKDGCWYVKDNKSSNGTFVNSKDIGENGVKDLHNGDELKLGHRPDSIAFRITI